MFIYICSWSFALYCTNILGTGDAASEMMAHGVEILKKSAGGEASFPDRPRDEGWEAEHTPLGTGL